MLHPVLVRCYSWGKCSCLVGFDRAEGKTEVDSEMVVQSRDAPWIPSIIGLTSAGGLLSECRAGPQDGRCGCARGSEDPDP
jgi:hypothetical protein